MRKGNERSIIAYRKPNCAALAPRDDVYQHMCMMSDVLIIRGITGPGPQQEACLQATVPPLITEACTFRTFKASQRR